MKNTNSIFIFAGEQSGDLLGSALVSDIKQAFPHLAIDGVGGKLLRSQGLNSIMDLESFQTMGFINIVKRLPFFFSSFFKIKRYILKTRPVLVILIDYPGFNLRMAKALKKAKFASPIVQYVCPSVWAWGKKRIPLMETYLDSLMTILPFEPALFNREKLCVDYVGHPLSKNKTLLINKDQKEKPETVALFPGSRSHEIQNNLPIMLAALKKIHLDHPHIQFCLVAASEKSLSLIKPILLKYNLDITIKPHNQLQEVLGSSDLALATSGTITLEIAMAEIPTVVIYHVSPLDVFLAKKVFKVNLAFFSLPNIIAKKAIYTELIGPNLTEESLTKALSSLIDKPQLYQQTKKECQLLKKQLDTPQRSSAFHFLQKHYSFLLNKKN
ncbi:lipid-A-disaccharide synthase [Candidatus Aerophobetes bacterium]|uniref:Lipid-A-disaccharide synthase n=1 Tax=Aerophobetes bacterium TaxID=2030807 RepID=A0A2A4X7E7_UNCAE|nr:MAG: lipid-A-disaccharide synthase [Candidatus Aerophobetes bacterium]